MKRTAEETKGNGEKRARTARCRHWARGSCKLEDECNFAHADEAGKALCRHWARGKCNLGEECKFSHYGEPGTGASFRPAMPFFGFPPSQNFFPAQGQPPFGQAGGFPPQQGMYQPFQQPGFGAQPFGGASARRGASCRHFQRGFCERGEGCTFSHMVASGGAKAAANGAAAGPCRHFTRGFCQLGHACKFAHA